jgi:hypothetical protein
MPLFDSEMAGCSFKSKRKEPGASLVALNFNKHLQQGETDSHESSN